MRRLAVTVTLLLAAFWAEPAHACWSGLNVRGQRVAFNGHDSNSHMSAQPSVVRPDDVVRWVQYLDRVLPDEVEVLIDHDVQVTAGGEQFRFEWNSSFRQAADELSARLKMARISDPAGPTLYTVQLAAGASREGANSAAIAAHCHAHSDVVTGVFPGCNQLGRVVKHENVFRVLYGTYLSRESAARAAAKLADRTGQDPFVRRL